MSAGATPIGSDPYHQLHAALQSSLEDGDVLLLPTLLVENEHLPPTAVSARPEDRALAWFVRRGLFADRTRRNDRGYPGHFRDLASVPPWVDVEPEDCVEPLGPERREGLRPLYLSATKTDAEIAGCLDAHVDVQDAMRDLVDLPVGAPLAARLRRHQHERLREQISLARVLGPDSFEALIPAVFEDYDLDPVTAAAGAPDLLVWHPDSARALWFFAEVKGPSDRLRPTQAAWIRRHWPVVRGHVILLAMT